MGTAGEGSSLGAEDWRALRDARRRAVALLVLLGATAWFVDTRLRVTTEITHFLPPGEDAASGRLLRFLGESAAARTALVSVEGADADGAEACASSLAEALRAERGVAWVRGGADERLQRAFFDAYFPHRFGFAFDVDGAPQPLTDGEIREGARRLMGDLASPLGPMIAGLAPRDPFAFFAHHADDAKAAAGEARGLLAFATEASPFQIDEQVRVEGRLAALFAALQRRDPRCTGLEHTSVARFAVASQTSIRDDVQRISVLSSVAIVALFLLVFRSLRLVLLGFVPLVAGCVVAMAAGIAAFGTLHGITLAFGSSLLGVGIDYVEHFFTHHVLHPDPRGPLASLRRVWPGLWMGALTTVAGLAGFAWTSFPGVREIAFFAVVAVAASLGATRWIVAPFVPLRPRAGALHGPLEGRLARATERLRLKRGWLLAFPGAALLVAAVGLPRARVIDDVAALNTLDPQLLAEDARVRARAPASEGGHTLVVTGEGEEASLVALEGVLATLETAKKDGMLATFSSVHPFLRSARAQRASTARLTLTPDLPARFRRIFREEGFVPERFEPFVDEVARAGAVSPLTWDDLAGNALGEVAGALRVDVEGRPGWVVSLGGVTDARELRERLRVHPTATYVDQHALLTTAYRRFRKRTAEMVVVGLLVVAAIVVARYRSARLTAAAFLPSLLAAVLTVSLHALAGKPLNLLHGVGLLLVLSMGVDYGVFMVEGRKERGGFVAAFLSICVATLTTVVSFGLLAFSANPALSALGSTAAVGMTLTCLLAPAAVLLVDEAGDPP